MGNSPTCIDCNTKVPKTVRFFDWFKDGAGRVIYKYFTESVWIRIGKTYLCPQCATKRNEKIRQEEAEEELRKHEEELVKQKAEEQRKKNEAIRIRNEEQRRRQREAEERIREEIRKKEEEKSRQRAEQERKRQLEEIKRRREEEEKRRLEFLRLQREREEAEYRRQMIEAAGKRRLEEDRKRKEEEERKRKEEYERKRREEEELELREEEERKRKEEENRKRREEEDRKRREEIREYEEIIEDVRLRKERKADALEAERQSKSLFASKMNSHLTKWQRKQSEKELMDTREHESIRNKNETLREKVTQFVMKTNISYKQREISAIHEDSFSKEIIFTNEPSLTANDNDQIKDIVSTRSTDRYYSSDENLFAIPREEELNDPSEYENTSRDKLIDVCINELMQEKRPAKTISMLFSNQDGTIILSHLLFSEIQSIEEISDFHTFDLIQRYLACFISGKLTAGNQERMEAVTNFVLHKLRTSLTHSTVTKDQLMFHLSKMLFILYLDSSSENIQLDVYPSCRQILCDFQRSVHGSKEEYESHNCHSVEYASVYFLKQSGEIFNLLHALETDKASLVLKKTACKNFCDIYKKASEPNKALLILKKTASQSFCDIYEKDNLKTLHSILQQILDSPEWTYSQFCRLSWSVYNSIQLQDIKPSKFAVSQILQHQISGHLMEKRMVGDRWKNIEETIPELVKLCNEERSLEVLLGEMCESRQMRCEDTKMEIIRIINESKMYLKERKKSNSDCPWSDVENAVKSKHTQSVNNVQLKAQYLAYLSYCVHKSQNYWPNNPQMISWCFLAICEGKGCLLEINTGEGKSCILAMFAAYLGMRNRDVDIITSSPVLAARDASSWASFYALCGVSVSCNVSPNNDLERQSCYENTIVYGNVGTFASDILRHEFLMKNVRGGRKYDAVVIDEVDCMLLDQGIQLTYLSHAAPGMHHLEPILLMIWCEVKKYVTVEAENCEKMFVGPPNSIWSAMSTICHDFDDHLRNLVEQVIYEIDSTEQNDSVLGIIIRISGICDLDMKVYQPDKRGRIKRVSTAKAGNKKLDKAILLVKNGNASVLYQNAADLKAQIENKITELVNLDGNSQSSRNTTDDTGSKYEIPVYLIRFVQKKLSLWIENAFTAVRMTEGREYLVSGRDIAPIDFASTGIVELSTKWGDGLQQFLEFKHGLKVSPMTLVTNFMSNQTFFKRYGRNVYGVSGTLGSISELRYLKNTYSLECTRIPTNRKKKLFELPGILCNTQLEWRKTVIKRVKDECQSGRVCLVICEDINKANILKQEISTERSSKRIFSYVRNDDEEQSSSLETTFDEGDVIVATNLAGRGTDFSLSKAVNDNGGLFVLITFLPRNQRVEKQAFGRTARKGNPGSSQLILNTEVLMDCMKECTEIAQLKWIRGIIEKGRLKSIERVMKTRIEMQEHLFIRYCEFQQTISVHLGDKNEQERQLTLESLHENWGLWLKMQSENFASDTNCDSEIIQKRLLKDLDTELLKAKARVLEKASPCENIYHVIKFANELKQQGRKDEAEKLYDKAIESDNHWAVIAHYNKAYSIIVREKHSGIDRALSHMQKAQECIGRYVNEVSLCVQLFGCDRNLISVENGYWVQLQTRIDILGYYDMSLQTTVEKLNRIKNEELNFQIEAKAIFDLCNENVQSNDQLKSELKQLWQLGLIDVFSINDKPLFNWSAILVTVTGMMQALVGTLIVLSTAGALAKVGFNFIMEGAKDVFHGVVACVRNKNVKLGLWVKNKVFSIAITVLTTGVVQYNQAGISGLKSLVQDARRVSDAPKMLISFSKDEVVNSIKTFSVNLLKEAGPDILSSGLSNLKSLVANKLKEKLKSGVENMLKDPIFGKYLSHIMEYEKVKSLTGKMMDKLPDGMLCSSVKCLYCRKSFIPECDKGIIKQLQPLCNECVLAFKETKSAVERITGAVLEEANHEAAFSELNREIIKGLVKTVKNTLKDTELKKKLQPVISVLETVQGAAKDLSELLKAFGDRLSDKLKTFINGLEISDIPDVVTKTGIVDADILTKLKEELAESISAKLKSTLDDTFDVTSKGLIQRELWKKTEELVKEYVPKEGTFRETLDLIYDETKE